MEIDAWQLIRRKDREPLWACRVTVEAVAVFESREVSLRLRSEQAALWLARQVRAAHQIPSSAASRRLEWRGDLTDDCQVTSGGLFAHAEWLQGPRRGGSWYCSVTGNDGTRYFHTADSRDIEPRSGPAARWLCELLIFLVSHGQVEPFDD